MYVCMYVCMCVFVCVCKAVLCTDQVNVSESGLFKHCRCVHFKHIDIYVQAMYVCVYANISF